MAMLSDDQLARYRDEGYLVLEAFFSGSKLARYRSILDDLVRAGRSMAGNRDHFQLELDAKGDAIPGMLHNVQGVCVVEPRVLEIAGDEELLDVVEMLTGPDIDVFGTKFFPKLPKVGTSTDWHQDNHYFGTNSDRIVSCGIYYEAADRDNGCLRVVPASHCGGLLVEHESVANRYGRWTKVDESKAVDVVCPAGTVVLFSANLLHGATDNHSERTRYSTAWHYIPGNLQLDRFRRGEYEDLFIVRGE